ncbi:sorbitol dehydrogenase [Candidatus Magnetomorum sp. HK-1]|nr:sorbitol dehydrogenase [Candidatus Magnetomorum sp. HK-1]
MKSIMKCIKVSEIGKFSHESMTIPRPGPDDVCIQVEVTGLCRTDLKLIRQGHRDLTLPRIPGEEVVGIIVEKGKNVQNFPIGQRVYVYPGMWCEKCDRCKINAENMCTHMEIMGFHRDGGFAEYVNVPAKTVIPVPDGLHPDHAVFAEPLSCCLNALELAQISANQRIGIWGAGPAGTLLHRAAKTFNAKPINIDPHPDRCQRIDGYPECPDIHFDIAIVAVGDRNAYASAIKHLNPRGTLVIFSGLQKNESIFEIDFNDIHYHETRIVGAYGCCFRHGIQALSLLSEKKLPVDDLISHQMPLDNLNQGLDIVEKKLGMKVLLYPMQNN